jgi:iron complex transport system substrate-binding protein
MKAQRPLFLLGVAAMFLAACGSDGGSSSVTSEAPTSMVAPTTVAEPASSAPTSDTAAAALKTTYPLTIENCGRELTFDSAPKRVVILNGSSVAEVESFIALGLQSSIAANSQSYGVSDDPTMVAAIAAIPTGGMQLNENFEVPRETVLAQNPDLVISTWSGGFDPKIGSISRDDLESLGINSYVPPSNCANGLTDPSSADTAALAGQSYESSFELLRQFGVIFDVQPKAESVIAEQEARIAAVSKPVGADPAHVLVVYPGMSMMNANNLPAAFTGPLYDSIIAAAGGVSTFVGKDSNFAAQLNAEALAAADVDVLVIGLFLPDENADVYAEELFKQYPEWSASKTGTYTSVADSFYLGPLNAVAIEKIGKAIASLG